jgi:PIN domain nuclease of toxin-antitoxin system
MIMLDTCALIWDALDQSRLTTKALAAIEQADEHHALMVADISLWEVAMLISKGRVEMNTGAANFIHLFLQSRSVRVISISPEIAELSTTFGDETNRDPADRIIAATSIIHNARLVTADDNLRNSDLIDTIW